MSKLNPLGLADDERRHLVNKTPASLREAMPTITEFIDACRVSFGKDEINQTIRAGMAGLPVFHASENGHTVGTPIPEAKVYTCMTRDITPLVIVKRGCQ